LNSNNLLKYKYNGARSLVLLHEKHLLSFAEIWKEAKKLNITLPTTDDKDYESLETLLFHVLRAARGYMTWICEELNLPDPEINTPPDFNEIENEADNYILHLLERWRFPLSEIKEEKFHSPTFKSRWGVEYCIDAMLEHAVMHPIRHEFQLRNLITEKK
jgi:uncharacterized damage-inducible protein DinB